MVAGQIIYRPQKEERILWLCHQPIVKKKKKGRKNSKKDPWERGSFVDYFPVQEILYQAPAVNISF